MQVKLTAKTEDGGQMVIKQVRTFGYRKFKNVVALDDSRLPKGTTTGKLKIDFPVASALIVKGTTDKKLKPQNILTDGSATACTNSGREISTVSPTVPAKKKTATKKAVAVEKPIKEPAEEPVKESAEETAEPEAEIEG